VNVTFSNSRLEKLANNYKKCQKDMGQIRAKLFHKRLGDLHNAFTLEDVRHLPGRYHELTGDRKGQWACDLDHPYRLVFEPHEKPVPTDQDGKFIWLQIRGIEMVEIVNYHGK
jgi:proteic killer suppression protein